MKRCPECRRDYVDDTLLYCLEDGEALVQGSVASSDEPHGAIPSNADALTQQQILTTDRTVILPRGTEAEPRRSFDSRSERQSLSAHRAAQPQEGSTASAHRFAKPLIAVAVAAVVLIGGFFGYRYFGTSSSKQIESIAVMPFVNESGSSDIDYLSDGMTDTLINNLSRIPNLSVKARSSVFKYKGKDIEPQKVAADLNVQAVVNGRVMQRGNDLTLNLEMVDAATGDQIWGEQYIRKVDDLVSLQSDIARDVSNKLREKLSGPVTERISKHATENPQAYREYLKGRFYWNKRTIDDINKSIEYFQKAIEIDPAYARAYAGLADSYVVIPSYSNNRSKEAFPKARAAAMKALEIDNSLAEAHATLADVLLEFDWKFEESEREFKRAIELDPNYATAHHWYAEFLLGMGRRDEALAEIKRAQECDPLSLIINSMIGIVHALRGDYAEAETQLKKTIEMDPNFARAHMFLAELYEEQGRFEEAIDEYEKYEKLLGPPSPETVKGLGFVRDAYRARGASGYWKAMLDFAKRRAGSDPDSGPPQVLLARLSVLGGDKEGAFQYFEKAFEQRDPDLLRLADPAFDPIRTDPRFAELVRRIGLPL